jgi:folylpolyglutamate synthase
MASGIVEGEDESYEAAVEALLSPLHQSTTPEAIFTASRRRTVTPSDMRTYLARCDIIPPHHGESAVIHITGTKGKGSTAAFCESILRTHYGLSTGLFSSPHLVTVRERIRLNGLPISCHEFAKAYFAVRKSLEAAAAALEKTDTTFTQHQYITKEPADENGEKLPPLPILPGYFRMLTLVALYVFRHHDFSEDIDPNSISKPVDVIILEVGMGGRYDATNVLDFHPTMPTVCGVTLIDLDHVRVLGNTKEQIAWEKGGIFLPNKVLRPSSDQNNSFPAAQQRFFTADSNTQSVISVLEQCANEQNGNDNYKNVVHISKRGTNVDPSWTLGLSGHHQYGNAELAYAMCHALMEQMGNTFLVAAKTAKRKSLQQALYDTSWPGRCQTVAFTPHITLRCDGAHTPQSMAAGLEWFSSVSRYTGSNDTNDCDLKRILIFNSSHERNPVPLVQLLQSILPDANEFLNQDGVAFLPLLFDAVYFCHADSERPSMITKSTAFELLQQAGFGIDEKEPANAYLTTTCVNTWQETMACIWKYLEVNGETSRRHEAHVFVNLSVKDALEQIKGSAGQDETIEVCVTGSLYMVGSALAAVEWVENSAQGHLDQPSS